MERSSCPFLFSGFHCSLHLFSDQEDLLSSPLPVSGDLIKKRAMLHDGEGPTNSDEVAAKRTCYSPMGNSASLGQIAGDFGQDDVAVNGISPKVPLLDNDLTPVEQMIAMIGALLAEGERGAESLEILISKIHPDLLADIVMANMKHLPKNPPPLASRLGNVPVASQMGSSSIPAHVAPTVPIVSVQSAAVPTPPSAITIGTSLSDASTVPILPADYNRDPRRVWWISIFNRFMYLLTLTIFFLHNVIWVYSVSFKVHIIEKYNSLTIFRILVALIHGVCLYLLEYTWCL